MIAVNSFNWVGAVRSVEYQVFDQASLDQLVNGSHPGVALPDFNEIGYRIIAIREVDFGWLVNCEIDIAPGSAFSEVEFPEQVWNA